jgi:TonB family protein
MSILRNKYEIIDETQNEGYTIPAVVRNDDEAIPFKRAIAISTFLHPGSVGLAWGLIALLAILGINIHLFKAPNMEKKQDIEFVLVDKPAPPKNPETKNRAEMNSRTGGIRDKKKPVVMPTGQSKQPSKPSSATSSLQKMVKQQQKQIQQEHIQQKQAPKKSVESPKSAVTAPSTQTRPSPKPPAQRPTAAPSTRPVSAPKTVAQRPTTPFSVPVPSSAPRGNYLSTGPVSGTGAKTGAHSGGSVAGSGGAGRHAPTPSLSTYKGTGSGTGSSAGSGGTRNGGGYAGNPGGGGGRPGIDALKEPDFGPYMRDLQRRIKFNWNPPKGNESKRVVLLFKIAKNGQLLSCKVHKSSGLPAADQAAINAVKLTAPFRPLPAEYKGTSIDIQFTFDYNVFGASRY